MDTGVYDKIKYIAGTASDKLISALGGDYGDYLRGSKIEIPSHLKSVPEHRQYVPATSCIVMAAVREAYGRGLHLHDIDYCCPPAVLIFENKRQKSRDSASEYLPHFYSEYCNNIFWHKSKDSIL